MIRNLQLICLFAVIGIGLWVPGVFAGETVVVYTSVDQVFSEPVLKAFEATTGIHVRALYDVEAAKTVGLVNRLIAEKRRPAADVFWNSEISRTIMLKQKGVLASYVSPNRKGLSPAFYDPGGYWTGFAARARVILYNTRLVSPDTAPSSIFELTEPKWRGRVAMANPLFGTASMHMAALWAQLGEKRTKEWLSAMLANKVAVVNGNSVARDMVVSGRAAVCITDTDDAAVAIEKKAPVAVIFADQKGIGALLIPSSVAMIRRCPHPDAARRLIDFLLSKRVEEMMARGESAQMPLHKGVLSPTIFPPMERLRFMRIGFNEIADAITPSARMCRKALGH
ncbi:MAG: extracellular solute-binding protein [Deltaproteobacteria bacterium]|nr:extracellular solute-binding protein [Deltaproteobacteria bacterium]